MKDWVDIERLPNGQITEDAVSEILNNLPVILCYVDVLGYPTLTYVDEDIWDSILKPLVTERGFVKYIPVPTLSFD